LTTPLLCVTVTADTTAGLRRARDEVADADLVELRLDSVRDPDVAGALAGRRTPVIVTCRPAWEGGAFAGSEEERRRILGEALALGAEYVDIEWRAGFDDLVGRAGARLVLSAHDFDGIPADLSARVQAMRATGARIVKIAVKATRLSDCVALRDLGVRAGADGGLALVAMGEAGIVTRVLPGRFGSAWTYAGSIGGIGQVSPETLVRDYRYRALGASTALYGLVGGSVTHSVSPAMHNAAFRALEIDAVYLPLPAASADDFVRFAKAFDVRGASVTIPHKVALLERVDEVDAVARRVGALNTIRVSDGRWMGGNTDVEGFLAPLQQRIALPGLRAAVLGAGGGARAVVSALASCGCQVRVHARRADCAAAVAGLAGAEVGPWPPEPESWDLLVNCTPIGQHPRVSETPLPIERLTGRYVYDLVYNPPVTRLLRDAAAAGCQAIGGLDMLVAQAQAQFRWWTGSKAPGGIMREAALKRLAEFAFDEDHLV
jgi:shikimate dehydrogenase/3-dehydroquinate dehydratase type I